MNRTKVLIPLDGSETSQQILSVLCRFFQPDTIDVVLMQVASPLIHPATDTYVSTFDVSLTDMRHWQGHKDVEEHWQKMQEDIRAGLEVQAERLRREGYSAAVEVRAGTPVEEIVRYVEEDGVDLVAMATHGRKGINRLLMGSVAEEVLRTVSVPVLLDRPVGDADTNVLSRPFLYAMMH